MKLNEVQEKQQDEIPFDVAEDLAIFMRNDPMFYRKTFFPAMADVSDKMEKGDSIDPAVMLKPIVDQGVKGYCKKYIKDKYFLMLLPDDLIMKSNCSKSMISIHKKYNSSVMASMKVNKKDVSRWGIYNIKKNIDKNNFIIKNVVEKPSIKSAPSKNAVIGRYILPKTIFKKLSKLRPGSGKEIHITDAIQSLIDENYRFIGHNFNGKYLDCGTMKGYINSTLEIAKI